MLIEKQLQRDEYTARVIGIRDESSHTNSADTATSVDVLLFDIACTDAAGRPLALPLADYSGILGALRKRIRDVVEEEQGTQIDWAITEAYHSRLLIFQYRQGMRLGWLELAIAPKTDSSNDLTTRLRVQIEEKEE